MSVVASRIAARINEAAARGEWVWSGWVALWRHGALARDVLGGEYLRLRVPPVDLDDAVMTIASELRADGWIVSAGATPTLDRWLLVSSAVTDATPVHVLLQANEAVRNDWQSTSGWPTVSLATSAANAGAQLLTAPTPNVRHAAAVDLLMSADGLPDRLLLGLLDEIAPSDTRHLVQILDALPRWLVLAGPRGGRDLLRARRRLISALPVIGIPPAAASSSGAITVDDPVVAALLGCRSVDRSDTPLLARAVELGLWEQRHELLQQLTANDIGAVWSRLTLSAAEREQLDLLRRGAA